MHTGTSKIMCSRNVSTIRLQLPRTLNEHVRFFLCKYEIGIWNLIYFWPANWKCFEFIRPWSQLNRKPMNWIFDFWKKKFRCQWNGMTVGSSEVETNFKFIHKLLSIGIGNGQSKWREAKQQRYWKIFEEGLQSSVLLQPFRFRMAKSRKSRAVHSPLSTWMALTDNNEKENRIKNWFQMANKERVICRWFKKFFLFRIRSDNSFFFVFSIHTYNTLYMW